MNKKYDVNYKGLNDLTKRQIESLAFRTGLKIIICQNVDRYFIMLYNGAAASKFYKGVYKKNKNYPNSIYQE